MNDQKWLEEKKYTTQPLYLIQDSTITTAIDIIKPSKHSIITSACPLFCRMVVLAEWWIPLLDLASFFIIRQIRHHSAMISKAKAKQKKNYI